MGQNQSSGYPAGGSVVKGQNQSTGYPARGSVSQRPEKPVQYLVQPRQWRNSNFLRLYSRSTRTPCLNLVKRTLEKVAGDETLTGGELKAWRKLKELAEQNNLTAAQRKEWKSVIVAQWTGVGGRGRGSKKGVPLFALLNEALIEDSPERLKDWIPFIRALNNVCYADKPETALIVYRGSKYTHAQGRALFVKGQIFRACMFVAASLDYNVADAFSYDKVIFKIKVPKDHPNACPIHKISKMDSEREVLFTPYSAFRVVNLVAKGEELIIELDALDNLIVDCWEQTPMLAEDARKELEEALKAANHSGPVYAQPI